MEFTNERTWLSAVESGKQEEFHARLVQQVQRHELEDFRVERHHVSRLERRGDRASRADQPLDQRPQRAGDDRDTEVGELDLAGDRHEHVVRGDVAMDDRGLGTVVMQAVRIRERTQDLADHVGDSLGLATGGGNVYAAWTDTRDGNQNIYFTKFSINPGVATPNDYLEANDTSATATVIGRVLAGARRPSIHEVDEVGMAALVAAAESAGVERFVCMSFAGVDAATGAALGSTALLSGLARELSAVLLQAQGIESTRTIE